MTPFSIISPGTYVLLKGPDGKSVNAQVLWANIGPRGHITYDVVWWSGSTRQNCCVDSSEVETLSPSVDKAPVVYRE